MKVRFGAFTFDNGQQQLLAGGRNVPLSPKAFGVLDLLLGRRPDVVDKATIAARVWPDTHVTDASLTMVVAELRKALGDAPEAPRFIRTAHRRGYAFCGDAEELDSPSHATTDPRCWLVLGDTRTVLNSGDTIVGRDPACDVWLDVPSVSWRHARFVIRGRAAALEDLESTNGTFVRGQRIGQRTELRQGDAILFGEVAATFEASRGAAGARTERLPGSRPA